MSRLGATLALLLAAAGCTRGAAAPATPADAPFVWQLRGSHATHHLMGSVHLLPPSAHPLPRGLDAAYRASAGLVLESDLAALSSPEVQQAMLTGARAATPAGLKAQVPASLYARLAERAAALGMPMGMCDAFKAWFCALSLEVFSFQQAGFEARLGIDQHYYARARADGKPVGWLEPPQEHLSLFLDMPEALGEQFLAATVDELTEAGQSPQELLRIWRRGDVAALAEASRDFQQRHPQAYERLLAARNRLWVGRLRAVLDAPTSQLVIVGAAHLAGPGNLVELLQAEGVRLTPLR